MEITIVVPDSELLKIIESEKKDREDGKHSDYFTSVAFSIFSNKIYEQKIEIDEKLERFKKDVILSLKKEELQQKQIEQLEELISLLKKLDDRNNNAE